MYLTFGTSKIQSLVLSVECAYNFSSFKGVRSHQIFKASELFGPNIFAPSLFSKSVYEFMRSAQLSRIKLYC